MVSKALGLLKWSVVIALVGGITLLAVRAFDAQRGPDLELWHTFVPHELSAAELDKADWKQFLAAEAQAFAEVRSEVTDKLGPEARIESNRYDANSPIYPGKFATDWNRSYVMQPEGKPVGAVVLLHGLTDSPYSLRHIARRYQEAGFVAVAARMPGHGTVPGGLTTVEWEQWTAATRLSVREAQRLAGPGAPLHVIGFSNGGALAMKYALEALGDKSLARPDRIVLIAPMIGITAMARFAGVMGWPALLPRFAKAAWLGLVPEFNPFKYNSFPVNGARQSSLVANRLQQEINAAVADGKMAHIAPVQTFQSVVDFTVSTRAIVDALYVNLPANGSELVLFDVNRNTKIGALMRANTDTVVTRLLPAAPRKFRATIITNESPRHAEVVERVTEAGATTEQVRPLGLLYPRQVFSLSHLALTFPMNDSLYGLQPDEPEEYGVNLGSMATRGERGTLIVSLDSLSRMSANPFFPYLIERIAEGFKGLPAAK
ncbi:alpha/beta hydrolase [Paucibacter sp. TC2R-5]|uniref:alpha/beta hydrolase n=1 Tax=Paucibacter sp. TC2R-5 TaxID=2893555 RepID=UPI0021E4BF99|nr:alpha/beta hydrolase [Paucibacter sp. TC2R-5]MCV2360046.1 alpha/beta hydrolase [Paucibacter sp. TC2R-5]